MQRQLLFRRCLARLAARPPRNKPAPARRPAGPEAQVTQFVRKKRSALCIAVVEAADFEGSCLPRPALRALLGTDRPVLLAVSKVDRLPRLLDNELRYLKGRFESKGPRCIGAHAVSAHTGMGVAQLASRALEETDGTGDIIVFGAKDSGKSELVLALADAFRRELSADALSTHVEHPLLPLADADGRKLAPTVDVTAVHCFEGQPKRALWDTPGWLPQYVAKLRACMLHRSHLCPPHPLPPTPAGRPCYPSHPGTSCPSAFRRLCARR